MDVPQYKWAKEVKEMDGYKCAYCGSIKQLEAHHIRPVHIYPEFGTCVENGVTLCRKCHQLIHLGGFSEDTVNMGHCEHVNKIRKYALSLLDPENVICFYLPKGKREEYRRYADSQGTSLAKLIQDLIEADMASKKEG